MKKTVCELFAGVGGFRCGLNSIMNLDDTRPYRRQSPYSLTDIGNDKTSGESHHNPALGRPRSGRGFRDDRSRSFHFHDK